MSVNFRRAVCAVFVAAGLIGWTTVVDAAPGGTSVAIKFGADQPDGPPADPGDMDTSAVNGPAGVFGTANWNNMTGPNQMTPQVLNADINGVSSPAPVTVTWSSNGLWSSTGRGEENNTAPAGDNRDLMAGYLDTAGLGGVPVVINVAGIPPLPGLPAYDVYVYTQGGVNGRGGTYTIGGTTLEHTVTAAFNGAFLQDTLDPGTTADSNYLVFRGLTGPSFTLTAVPTIGGTARAPVNAIEIVAVPEPATIALLGIGAVMVSAGIALRRRD
jgi:hypothetical protein